MAWTFAAAKGFFDVVTYEGDGVINRAVPHSLNSIPVVSLLNEQMMLVLMVGMA